MFFFSCLFAHYYTVVLLVVFFFSPSSSSSSLHSIYIYICFFPLFIESKLRAYGYAYSLPHHFRFAQIRPMKMLHTLVNTASANGFRKPNTKKKNHSWNFHNFFFHLQMMYSNRFDQLFFCYEKKKKFHSCTVSNSQIAFVKYGIWCETNATLVPIIITILLKLSGTQYFSLKNSLTYTI